MSTRKIFKLLPLLLLMLLALALAPVRLLQSAGAIRYVNNSDLACLNQAPCYTTIQAAIDAAQAGDTVRIQAGQYNEIVVVKGKNKASGATEADRIFIEADSAAPLDSVIMGASGAVCTPGTVFQFASSRFGAN